MKKIGDLMRDMGFNENASTDAKKAFLKHLMREAQFHDRITAIDKYQEPNREQRVGSANDGEQLSLFVNWDAEIQPKKKTS